MKKLLLIGFLAISLGLSAQKNTEVDPASELQITEVAVATQQSFDNMKAKLHPTFVKLKGEEGERLYDQITYQRKYVILTNYYAVSKPNSTDLRIMQVDKYVKRNKLVRSKIPKEKNYSSYEAR